MQLDDSAARLPTRNARVRWLTAVPPLVLMNLRHRKIGVAAHTAATCLHETDYPDEPRLSASGGSGFRGAREKGRSLPRREGRGAGEALPVGAVDVFDVAGPVVPQVALVHQDGQPKRGAVLAHREPPSLHRPRRLTDGGGALDGPGGSTASPDHPAGSGLRPTQQSLRPSDDIPRSAATVAGVGGDGGASGVAGFARLLDG
jgi:hypothetical protein